MANPEHLTRLAEGVEVWNRWRVLNPWVHVDLSEAGLSSAELSGVDFSLATLHGVELLGADLGRADLSRADLRDANLSGSDLRRADLRDADLRGADLLSVNFSQANLTGADLSETDLSGAEFFETVLGNTALRGAEGLEHCEHRGPSTIDLRTLQRSGLLPDAFLRGCGLPDDFIARLPGLIAEPVQDYVCFICHSQADHVFALRLHDALQGRGIRCWREAKPLLPGDDIYDHVDRVHRPADRVLLCVSSSSLTSWWVDREIDRACTEADPARRGGPGAVPSLLALDLDGCLARGQSPNGRGQQLRSRLGADFNGWARDEGRFQAGVENVIKVLRGG